MRNGLEGRPNLHYTSNRRHKPENSSQYDAPDGSLDASGVTSAQFFRFKTVLDFGESLSEHGVGAEIKLLMMAYAGFEVDIML